MEERIGHYAYVIGVVIALVLGIASAWLSDITKLWLTSILVVLGLIVGFLNITTHEIKDFMLYSVVLIIALGLGGATATLGGVTIIGEYLAGIFMQLLAFVVPATIIVCLKGILELTQHGNFYETARVQSRPARRKRKR